MAQPIGPLGVFTQDAADIIAQNIAEASSGGTSFRNLYYCDYAAGLDTNDGRSFGSPVKTLATAYGLCEAGKNDAVVVISNGASSGFQRISAAFTWAKASTHLIGVGNGISSSPRASIRPLSTAAAFTPFFTVSASGCLFANIGIWAGFTTGTTDAIGVSLTGDYNRFVGCHLVGLADAASAADAGSRVLKLTGSDENEFINCTFGVDTVTRSAANATIEFATGSARNKFVGCMFRVYTSSATSLVYLVSAASGIDRDTSFLNCQFIDAIKSGSTALTGLGTLPASAGGMLFFQNCTLVGVGEFGTDATTRAQVYVDGGTVTAATSGIAVNPT